MEEQYQSKICNHNTSVGDIFHAAAAKFALELSGDDGKVATANDANHLQNLQELVTKARIKYEVSHRSQKTRKGLGKVSTRLQPYRSIMDVIVQHHPEYVALAWGAMKFLFKTFLNHETIVSSLAKALSQIADALPRVDVSAMLYPTELMREAVVGLYTHLIRFFIRAYDWYQESTFKHVYHSVTRPYELRYKDLVEKVTECSESIDKLAVSGAQAEQRDMHKKLDVILSRQDRSDLNVREIKGTMISFQALNSSAALNTDQRLSDLQLSQIMGFLSKVPLIDSADTLRYYMFMRNRRARTRATKSDSFWLSSKLQVWSSAQGSSLSIVKGTFQSRFEVKDFCVNVIEQLDKAQVPVLWAMKMSKVAGFGQRASSIDVLKHLIVQALRLNPTVRTEKSMALSCARFQSQVTEKDWFQLLECVLAGMPNEVYILIDLETLSRELATLTQDFSWLSAFQDLFRNLSKRDIKTRVKVLLVSYGSPILISAAQYGLSDCVVQVKTPPQGPMRRRRGRALKKGTVPI